MDEGYLIHEMWRPADKYITVCAKCGREGLKGKMNSIYIKADKYSPMRILCHICQRCIPALLDELEVSMPD